MTDAGPACHRHFDWSKSDRTWRCTVSCKTRRLYYHRLPFPLPFLVLTFSHTLPHLFKLHTTLQCFCFKQDVVLLKVKVKRACFKFNHVITVSGVHGFVLIWITFTITSFRPQKHNHFLARVGSRKSPPLWLPPQPFISPFSGAVLWASVLHFFDETSVVSLTFVPLKKSPFCCESFKDFSLSLFFRNTVTMCLSVIFCVYLLRVYLVCSVCGL